jgi:cell division septum initiation protein DivIVA
MIKPTSPAPLSVEHIAQSILFLRGQRVILDRELAAIYAVPTKRLNEQVKRNRARFPADFLFQLTAEEAECSRSQFATLNAGRGRNIKHLPYAFTEHGAIQAANVLNSSRAIMMGVHVVRAFVQLRALLASNEELRKRLDELEARIAKKLGTHDQAITGILHTLRQLMNTPQPNRRAIGFTADLDNT